MKDSKIPDPNIFLSMMTLEQGQKLLIIFDRFGLEIAHWITEVATVSAIEFTAQYIPMLAQQSYAHTSTIPDDLKRVIKRYPMMLTALSDFNECTRFRAAILFVAQKSQSKTLHLPGVDWQMFTDSLIGFDPIAMQEEAHRIKILLAGARIVEIITRQTQGQPHKLTMSIENRNSHLDTGMPKPGEIAQLPAGEVYLAPVEFTAGGSIVVNGSVPGRVIRNSDSVILYFKKGLVDLAYSIFANTLSARGFKDELESYRHLDQNNLALGELGFGINNAIKRLTGSPIHDEKAAGTMHIALGSNLPFDGTIECDNHLDLVIIPEAVLVDGYELPIHWGLGASI